ncbi:MAG: hypothetical protein LBH59_08450, partial [Planctomycetaceae bacterium]|nr:hypothetical protein [Planctomycetaceae bacterium]MDR0391922.1 hypothetical protein [Planctomycetaceae bacterium]
CKLRTARKKGRESVVLQLSFAKSPHDDNDHARFLGQSRRSRVQIWRFELERSLLNQLFLNVL